MDTNAQRQFLMTLKEKGYSKEQAGVMLNKAMAMDATPMPISQPAIDTNVDQGPNIFERGAKFIGKNVLAPIVDFQQSMSAQAPAAAGDFVAGLESVANLPTQAMQYLTGGATPTLNEVQKSLFGGTLGEAAQSAGDYLTEKALESKDYTKGVLSGEIPMFGDSNKDYEQVKEMRQGPQSMSEYLGRGITNLEAASLPFLVSGSFDPSKITSQKDVYKLLSNPKTLTDFVTYLAPRSALGTGIRAAQKGEDPTVGEFVKNFGFDAFLNLEAPVVFEKAKSFFKKAAEVATGVKRKFFKTAFDRPEAVMENLKILHNDGDITQPLIEKSAEVYDDFISYSRGVGEKIGNALDAADETVSKKELMDEIRDNVLGKYNIKLNAEGLIDEKSFIGSKLQSATTFKNQLQEHWNTILAPNADDLTATTLDTIKQNIDFKESTVGMNKRAEAIFNQIYKQYSNKIDLLAPKVIPLNAQYSQAKDLLKELKNLSSAANDQARWSTINSIVNPAKKPTWGNLEKVGELLGSPELVNMIEDVAAAKALFPAIRSSGPLGSARNWSNVVSSLLAGAAASASTAIASGAALAPTAVGGLAGAGALVAGTSPSLYGKAVMQAGQFAQTEIGKVIVNQLAPLVKPLTRELTRKELGEVAIQLAESIVNSVLGSEDQPQK